MDDTTPPPDDDQLLDRLAAAGTVLDRLYAQAVEEGPRPLPGGDDRHGLRRPPRRRSPRSRGRALITAAVLLIAAAGTVAVLAGRSDQQGISTDQATSTTELEPSAQLAALAERRIDAVERCGKVFTEADWPRPWPQGWEQVANPDCGTGWVTAGAEAIQPIPVYADAVAGDPIAWWSRSTGWISLDEFDDPDFDLAAYRAAYQAELASRGDTTSTTGG